MKKYIHFISCATLILGLILEPAVSARASTEVTLDEVVSEVEFSATSSISLHEEISAPIADNLEVLSTQDLETDAATSLIINQTEATTTASDILVSETTVEETSHPFEILVRYNEEVIDLETKAGKRAAARFVDNTTLTPVDTLEAQNIAVLEVKEEILLEETIEDLESDSRVAYVQPNYTYEPAELGTNDPYADYLWGLDNTGQLVAETPGIYDADMDVPEAWSLYTGTTTPVIVAVIDTGVAYNHPDLSPVMWDGANCVDENGAPLGGCVHGYDFEDEDLTPLPTSSTHGTHIAGTIAAVRNNDLGVAGVAPDARIMALKVGLTTDEIIRAIHFAKQNGATIINASWVGSFPDQALYDAIATFPGIFVAAAGNESTNSDVDAHSYPSDFDLPNIISVAATDQSDALADFSNYGSVSVDVGAPGVHILSAISTESEIAGTDTPSVVFSDGSDETYGFMNGTSMATPHVVGLAALILGYVHNIPPARVRDIILTSGDTIPSLAGKTSTGKRINAAEALLIARDEAYIRSFSIPGQIGETNINAADHTITLTMPFGTDTTNLIPTITFTGSELTPASAIAQDFSLTKIYAVTARSGSTTQYAVTLHTESPPAQPVTRSSSSGGGGGGGSSKSTGVIINKGDKETTSPRVTLTLTPLKGTTHMMIANEKTFADASWIPFKKTYTWNLTDELGKKTVYVRFGKEKKKLDEVKDTIVLTQEPVLSKIKKAPLTSKTVTKNTVSPTFTKKLARGDKGTEVTKLQQILIKKKYLSAKEPSGTFDQKTVKALKTYQKAKKLKQTGILDAATRATLNNTVTTKAK